MSTSIVTLLLVVLIGLLGFWTTATIGESSSEGPVPVVVAIPATPVATP